MTKETLTSTSEVPLTDTEPLTDTVPLKGTSVQQQPNPTVKRKRGRPANPNTDSQTVHQQKKREDACEITLPEIADPVSRARALDDPVFFVEHCCKDTLRHRLPDALKDFVHKIVQSAKVGGNVIVFSTIKPSVGRSHPA